MPYKFAYAVKDEPTQNDYAHEAESDGKVVTGSYRVLLPDGRTQIVTYRADENGYVADVKYEGEAKYPEPSSNGNGNKYGGNGGNGGNGNGNKYGGNGGNGGNGGQQSYGAQGGQQQQGSTQSIITFHDLQIPTFPSRLYQKVSAPATETATNTEATVETEETEANNLTELKEASSNNKVRS